MEDETTILQDLFSYLIENNDYLKPIKKMLDNDYYNINYATSLLAEYYFKNIDNLSPNLFMDKIAENLQNDIEQTLNYCDDNELFY